MVGARPIEKGHDGWPGSWYKILGGNDTSMTTLSSRSPKREGCQQQPPFP